jgi:group I intron endonuclease
MIIYGITNKINGKIYIGQSEKDDITSSQSRPYLHLHGNGSKRLFSAVKCHGIENFPVLILYQRDGYIKELLNDLEKDFIKHFQTRHPNGYNLTDGGEGGDTFSSKSDEEKNATKKKRAETKANKSGEEKAESNRKRSESGIISQNKPETKKKLLDIWVKKSEEEKVGISRKQSESNKIAQNRPEVKLRQSEHGKYAMHIRWHKNRGIINPDCKFCINQEEEAKNANKGNGFCVLLY